MLLIQFYYGQINANNSRILRSSRTWLELHPKGKVILIGFAEVGDKVQYSEIEPGIHAYNIWVDQKLFTSIPFFGRLRFIKSWRIGILKLLSTIDLSDLKVIMSNSVSDLPIAVRIQKKYSGKIIYDAHELETERNELTGPHKKYDKWIERRYIQYASTTLVVSQKIKDWYVNHYPNKEIELIRNLPLPKTITSGQVLNRQQLAIPENHLLFIYIGNLNLGRGIEALLEAFEQIDNASLFLMGTGKLTPLAQKKANAFPNIFYHAPVKSTEVINYIKAADVGLSLIENTCLSYYYCLPNKLWEYLHADLPVIVSDFPEMQSFVEANEVGWSCNPTKENIKALIQYLDRETIEITKSHIKRTVLPNWEEEERNLVAIFEKI